MADVQQLVTAGIESGTKSEYILLDGGGSSIFPVAQQVHRGVFTLDGTTGTDTANLRLTLPLPSNIVWQLRTFQLTIETSVDWVRGRFEYFYNPSTTEFGQSTQLNFPMGAASQMTIPQGTAAITNWMIAFLDNSTATSGQWVEPLTGPMGPFDLISFNDVSNGADPVIALSTGAGAAVTEGAIRFGVTWLGYTFEQMRSSHLHAGFSNRI